MVREYLPKKNLNIKKMGILIDMSITIVVEEKIEIVVKDQLEKRNLQNKWST